TPAYYAWKGNAFETLCLNHVDQIKAAPEIRGVETEEYAWRGRTSSPGVQIDLLIDRRDNVINLCEMKCTDQPFAIDASYENSC
ncbi:MAG: ATP-binding protein, partial [Clostridia bacterium]|nr:ATP-binding protein [Clostridia bacterium]